MHEVDYEPFQSIISEIVVPRRSRALKTTMLNTTFYVTKQFKILFSALVQQKNSVEILYCIRSELRKHFETLLTQEKLHAPFRLFAEHVPNQYSWCKSVPHLPKKITNVMTLSKKMFKASMYARVGIGQIRNYPLK